jgi:hypothetical protein
MSRGRGLRFGGYVEEVVKEEKTIMELRAQLREIRESERRKMERAIERRSLPVRAELAELTAFARIRNRRKVKLSDVIGGAD